MQVQWYTFINSKPHFAFIGKSIFWDFKSKFCLLSTRHLDITSHFDTKATPFQEPKSFTSTRDLDKISTRPRNPSLWQKARRVEVTDFLTCWSNVSKLHAKVKDFWSLIRVVLMWKWLVEVTEVSRNDKYSF